MSRTEERLGKEAETLVDQLRQSIIQGVLMPNERLVEVELSERYAVGRAAVRAALLELTKERLVEHLPNRGARVRVFSIEEAIEVLEVRQVVETLCAVEAAKNATGKEIDDMRRMVERMETAVSDSDLRGYSDLNEQFHTSIRESSHHNVASEMVAGLRNQTRRHHFRVAFIPGRTEVSLEEHRTIYQAIADRDPVAAKKAMESHLQSVIDVVASNPMGQWV